MSSTASSGERDSEHDHTKKHATSKTWVVIAVMLAMFLAALDMTIIGTAMPSIIGDLHGVAIYSWVFSAYLLTSTVPIPLFAKLSDMYGRKNLFIINSAIFTIGSLLCGVSNNMPELIAFRALQGVGAAGVLPIALTIVGDVFTLEQRARIQGFFSAVWGISAIIGPLLGAFIVEYSSWRYVFEINVPIGILVMIVLGLTFKEHASHKTHKLDWSGTLLLTAGVTVLLLTLIQHSDHLAAPASLAMFAVAAILLTAFGFWEQRAKEPVLPAAIFRHRMILVANLVSFFGGMIMFGLISYIPLFVQGVQGGSPTLAGRAITPMMVGWPLAALVGGPLIMRVGYRIVGVAGGTLIAVGSWILIATGAPHTLDIDAGLLLIGLGMGLTLTGLLIAAQNAVAWNLRGAVTGSNQFFRTIGGSIGVAAMGAILNQQMATRVAASGLGTKVNLSSVTESLLTAKARAALAPSIRSAFARMLGGALHDVFIAGFVFAVILFALVLFIPGGKAHKHAAAHQEKS